MSIISFARSQSPFPTSLPDQIERRSRSEQKSRLLITPNWTVNRDIISDIRSSNLSPISRERKKTVGRTLPPLNPSIKNKNNGIKSLVDIKPGMYTTQ